MIKMLVCGLDGDGVVAPSGILSEKAAGPSALSTSGALEFPR
jgi:hypothetical protein